MEVIALTALIKKTTDILGNLALEQGTRLYWLKENVGWIQREMGFMKSFLEDADFKNNNSKRAVYFRKVIVDLAYDVGDILDSDFSKKFSKNKRLFVLCVAGTNSRLSMEIEGIRRRVDQIKSARATYGITEDITNANNHQDLDHRQRLLLQTDDRWTIGVDRKVKKLMRKLRDPCSQLGVISIVGPPGVGKTTLAKIIFKSSRQLHFDCRAFVYISLNPNFRDVLYDLARQVGLDTKLESDERNLENNLIDYLSRKRYLIAFDDVCCSHTWDFLKGIITSMSSKGSRVIVTSTDSSVGKYAGTMKVFKLQPLNEMESKELFHKLVMLNSKETTLQPVLEDIGAQILRKCGGLPIAIVSMAKLLASRDRTEAAWNDVLTSFMGENNRDDDWWEILARSYNFLPTYVKPCFLTFGLFPHDYPIPTFELINLWLAENFIHEEGVGIRHLNFLVSQNLVEVVCRGCGGKIQSSKIHTVLHHLCVKLSRDNEFFHFPNEIGSYSAQQVRRLAIHDQSIGNLVNVKQRCLKCRTLLWFDGGHAFNEQQIKEKLTHLKHLRFLILEFHMLECSLLDEIGSLCQLCYLRLTGYADCALPQTIEKLKKLVTLDVKDCKHMKLPMCIWKMKQLKHLFLSGNHLSKQLGPNILNFFRPCDTFLPNLQTLDGEDGCNLRPTWLTHLTNLRKLRIRNPSDQTIKLLSSARPMSIKLEKLRLGRGMNYLTERLDLSYHHTLVKLHLSIPMTRLPEADDFPPNLVKLTLLWTEIEADPMEVLQRLPKLRILKLLRNCYGGRSLIASRAYGFPQLEFLQLDGLWPLEEVVCDTGMAQLKRVIIENCSALQSIPKRFQEAMQKCQS